MLVRNPCNRRQVADISLDPLVVDALVLWSKNPAPMIPFFVEIEAMGYPLFLHYTISGCTRQLEPHLPELAERIASFRKCAELLGPERVHWRFDPIILVRNYPITHFLKQFQAIAQALAGYTTRCIISFVSLYAKCRRNMRGLELVDPGEVAKKEMIERMKDLAADANIRLEGCCDPFLETTCGLDSSGCIDASGMGMILNRNFQVKRDTGQRAQCGCNQSIDIGAYDSCPHGCVYCYANTNFKRAITNRAAHDPNSPILLGRLQGDETIHKRQVHTLLLKQESLFDYPRKL